MKEIHTNFGSISVKDNFRSMVLFPEHVFVKIKPVIGTKNKGVALEYNAISLLTWDLFAFKDTTQIQICTGE